jgi:hypothetical protein
MNLFNKDTEVYLCGLYHAFEIENLFLVLSLLTNRLDYVGPEGFLQIVSPLVKKLMCASTATKFKFTSLRLSLSLSLYSFYLSH